jgi:hypothetical protein
MPAFSTSSPSRTTTDRRTPWGKEVDGWFDVAWLMTKYLELRFNGLLAHRRMLKDKKGSTVGLNPY